MNKPTSVDPIVQKDTKSKETAMPTSETLAKVADFFKDHMPPLSPPSDTVEPFFPDRKMVQWLVNRSQGERELKKG